MDRGIGLRAFAAQLGISPSAVSQMETGKIRPTMKRLHDIVSALGIGMEEVFTEPGSPAGPGDQRAQPGQSIRPGLSIREDQSGGHGQHGHQTPAGPDHAPDAAELDRGVHAEVGDHPRLLLEDGVEWFQVSPVKLPDMEVLRTVYPPGARVALDTEFVRHAGWEMGYVISGRMRVQISFSTRDVGPGESICFNSAVPHKLSNPFDEPAEAIWIRSTRDPA
jgi:transcriptional regulator with XRE-family HTH domain/mannose-6-phosphate isomerase-like protein (cupin superfamily)